MQRKVAYGTIEEQLDMMYWDQVNGTTTWKDHVSSVKSNIVNQTTADAQADFYSDKREFEMGSEETPCWNSLPNEKKQKITRFANATTYGAGWGPDPALVNPSMILRLRFVNSDSIS